MVTQLFTTSTWAFNNCNSVSRLVSSAADVTVRTQPMMKKHFMMILISISIVPPVGGSFGHMVSASNGASNLSNLDVNYLYLGNFLR